MVLFLGMMHKIRFTQSDSESKSNSKELIMTKYILKLLTILSNILVSNLLIIDADKAATYVSSLTTALKNSLK